jgi:hypothetical protein
MPENNLPIESPLERFIEKRDLLLKQWRKEYGDEKGWSLDRLEEFADATKANATEEERTAWDEHIKEDVKQTQKTARARAFKRLHGN